MKRKYQPPPPHSHSHPPLPHLHTEQMIIADQYPKKKTVNTLCFKEIAPALYEKAVQSVCGRFRVSSLFSNDVTKRVVKSKAKRKLTAIFYQCLFTLIVNKEII